jgi:hypothetical protein
VKLNNASKANFHVFPARLFFSKDSHFTRRKVLNCNERRLNVIHATCVVLKNHHSQQRTILLQTFFYHKSKQVHLKCASQRNKTGINLHEIARANINNKAGSSTLLPLLASFPFIINCLQHNFFPCFT